MIINPYAFATGGGGSDPYWANVVALLHFDGADGSTTFTDETGRSWSRNGTTTRIATAQSKFGGSSLLVGTTSGSGTLNGLVSASSAGFDFGTGDFTIEYWNYLTSLADPQCYFSRGSFGSAGSMLIQKDAASVVVYIGASLVGDAPPVPTTSVWQHHVVCRDSGTVRRYLDGVQASAVAGAGSISHTAALGVGAYADGSYAVNGYLDELRITKGVCRYAGGTTFTPPSGPFPNS